MFLPSLESASRLTAPEAQFHRNTTFPWPGKTAVKEASVGLLLIGEYEEEKTKRSRKGAKSQRRKRIKKFV
jgi:hypothetical protein